MAVVGTRGVLEPLAGAQRFTLELRPPAPGLERIVSRHWIVRWDLRGRAPFVQDVLPHPCVNLAFEPGLPAVYGIPPERFTRSLTGAGIAVGTRFRPGGLTAYTDLPMAALTGRVLPAGEVLGPAGEELERAALATADPGARVALVEEWLRARRRPLDPGALLVQDVVDAIVHGRAGRTVAEVAAAFGVSARTLQRLFRRYVGVSPKWVLQRDRVHEAAERMLLAPGLDLGRLALDLGYADQAHFSADFHARTGRTPSAYLASCRPD